MKLSVVVITKNEELDLPGFIRSFKQIADEIVIVDDGSSDATESIARHAASKDDRIVWVSSPRDDGEGFCDLRNRGIVEAKGDWVLQVDCDMRIGEKMIIEINRNIDNNEFDAFRFKLEQYFLNHRVRHGGFQYWNQPWLSRRALTQWTQKVHERIHIDTTSNRIGQLKEKMVHLNEHNFSERMVKNYNYSHLSADKLIEDGRCVGLFQLFYQPFRAWFRSYILMRGFLDGRIGFVWGLYQFTSNANIYFLTWDRQNKLERKDLSAEKNVEK